MIRLAVFIPTGQIRFLSVPLESDYKNTLWFPNEAAQQLYMAQKIKRVFSNYNFVRKDRTIVVEGNVDDLMTDGLFMSNYMMYQNTNFGLKWFYAFIDKMEWASNNSTRVYFHTDVIQTWMFDITYYQSYVVRCHSDTDVAGDNIVPEDFTTPDGGYQEVNHYDLAPDRMAIFATALNSGSSISANYEDNMFSGAGVVWDDLLNTSTFQSVNAVLQTYVKNGLANAVVKLQQYSSYAGAKTTITYLKTPTNINGYIPVNQKLKSAAFVKCYVSMYGQEIVVNPAYINGTTVKVQMGVDKTSGMMIANITNYGTGNADNKNSTMNIQVAIPQSNWAYNQYQNDYNLHSGSNALYVKRQTGQRYASGVQNVLDLASNVAGLVGDLSSVGSLQGLVNLSTNPVGTVANTIGGVLNRASTGVGQVYGIMQTAGGYDAISQDLLAMEESYNAPATGGLTSSNAYIATNNTYLSVGYKVPPADIAKRIDKFFTVYGYKQSEYRNINLHARLNWTYIQTAGLNAAGDIPQEDMQIIKRAFDNGITFWAYTAVYGDYSVTNPIV